MPTFERLRLAQAFIGLRGLAFAPLAVSIFCLAGPAHAASFDCSKAKTSIERQICADADVSRQDGLLQETYQKLLKESAEPEKLKAAQRTWIEERGRCGGKEPDKTICLSLAYYARRGQLETELFLKQQNADKGATKAARYPDMWMMRTVGQPLIARREDIELFKFSQAALGEMGLSDAIEDFYIADERAISLEARRNKLFLRGFFFRKDHHA